MTDRALADRSRRSDPVAIDAFDERAEADPRLIVDIGGYEGPLDLLLDLARQQKVDLTRLSILALADQYLAFIAEARALRLELAADYLLMAAWLAYLKSRLLVPGPAGTAEPSGEDLAEELTARLKRLEAIRIAGEHLMARRRLGIDVFARGDPERAVKLTSKLWEADLIDLLKAYAVQRSRQALARVTFTPRRVWSLAEARAALERLVGVAVDWTRLDEFLIAYVVEPDMRASVIASSFATSLELVREGAMELRQEALFGPIYVRQKTATSPVGGEGG